MESKTVLELKSPLAAANRAVDDVQPITDPARLLPAPVEPEPETVE